MTICHLSPVTVANFSPTQTILTATSSVIVASTQDDFGGFVEEEIHTDWRGHTEKLNGTMTSRGRRTPKTRTFAFSPEN